MPLFQLRFRRDTTANWQAANPILLDGEAGYERTDDGRLLVKMGDGVMDAEGNITGTPWNDLPYASGPAGPAPKHQWQQTSLRFQNPDGSWGEAVNLKGAKGATGPKGPPGPEGTSTPATPSTLGGVMPRAGMAVNTEGYLDHDLAWSDKQCYLTPIIVLHKGAAHRWLAVNGLGTDAGVREPGAPGSESFWVNLNADALREELDILRKLSIGAPKFHRSTQLPPNHAWPDGSLVLFDDWPEFGEVYEQGGFAGMLMPWDADTEYQANHLGQYRPDSANTTGLYLPLHGGQFFRNYVLGGAESAGAWREDQMQRLTGGFSRADQPTQGVLLDHRLVPSGVFGFTAGPTQDAQSMFAATPQTNRWAYAPIDIDSGRVARSGAETVPSHIWQPVTIYLGRPK